MFFKTAFSFASPAGAQGRLAILIFHRVLPKPDPLFPDEPDIDRFDTLMGWVAAWFNVLPLDEAVARLKRGDLPARAAAITFDDGYADNWLHAVPVLKRHRLPATFFIASGFLDGGRMWNDTVIESLRATRLPQIDAGFLGLGCFDLTGDQARRTALGSLIPAIKHLEPSARAEAVERLADVCRVELPDDLMLTTTQLQALRAEGMTVGAHTVSHPILAKLDDGQALREMADSRDRLQALLGDRVSLFAYPNGKPGTDYGAAHVRMARQLGYEAAVSTSPGTGCVSSDLYQLPRFSPWDRSAWRYGLRMLANLRQPGVALDAVAS